MFNINNDAIYVLINDIVCPISYKLIPKHTCIKFNGYMTNTTFEFYIVNYKDKENILTPYIYYMTNGDTQNSILLKTEYLTQKINVLINND